MKQKFFSLLLGAILVAGLFSCGDDDDKKKASSSVTVMGKKYEFDYANYYFYEDGDDFCNVYILGINGDNYVGIEFDLITEPGNDLPEGTFALAEAGSTISYFDCLVYDSEFDVVGGYDDAKSGTIKIKKSGDTYTIDFSIVFDTGSDDVTVKGTYIGPVEPNTGG